jgi:endo-1,4-beta-D-glucanase Y
MRAPEGLSYGMMIAVELNKKKFSTASGDGQNIFST